MPPTSSSSSEEDLSAFASVAVDSHFIEKHAKVITGAAVFGWSKVDHPAVTGQRHQKARQAHQPSGSASTDIGTCCVLHSLHMVVLHVAAQVAAVLDARLARELEFDDNALHGVDGGQNKKAKKKMRRPKGEEDDRQDRLIKKKKRRPKGEDNGGENKPKKRKNRHALKHRAVDTIEDGEAVDAVRLFRHVPKGTPCQLGVANRPSQAIHSITARPQANIASSESDDEHKLRQVVVEATHIYSTAQEAARKAAANISVELVGASRHFARVSTVAMSYPQIV